MLEKTYFIKNLSGLYYLKDHYSTSQPKREHGYDTEAKALKDAELLNLSSFIIQPIYLKVKS